MKIVLTKRSHDWKAHLDGKSAVWGCGNSPDEAIGDLINSHQDTFNIQIEEWVFHQPSNLLVSSPRGELFYINKLLRIS